MSWPYQFLDLTTAQKQARRHALDRYGLIAQLSALVPVALFLLYRLASWGIVRATGSDRGNYTAVPNSPVLKRQRLSAVGSWTTRARKVAWWFGNDVVFLRWNWGPRDQIILGAVWTVWLLVLCVVGTGNGEIITFQYGLIADTTDTDRRDQIISILRNGLASSPCRNSPCSICSR